MPAASHPVPARRHLVAPARLPARAYPARWSSRLAARGEWLFTAWHLLSLDAPTVATLWVIFIARSACLRLPWTEPAAMFVAVWMLYAADRLLDARSASPQRDLEARHRFHHRHRVAFRAALLLAGPVLALLLRAAGLPTLRLDLLLGALLLAWLLLVHLWPSTAARLPKELAVGVFFPAAVFVPTVALLPALRRALLPDALLLAAACSLNCLYIFAWEHPHSRGHAHRSTLWAVQRLPQLTSVTTLAALGTATLSLSSTRAERAGLPAIACAASAGLLLLLHRRRNEIAPLTLRAAADLCLLTPALLLPFVRLLAR